MAKSLIPLRPVEGVFNLSQEEMDCLTYMALTGCSRKKAFLSLARPDLMISGSKPAIEDTIKQFFASKPAKDYIEAYTATLEEFLHPKPVEQAKPSGSIEERKARAKTKLVEFAMNLSNNIDQADDPEFVLKIADKAGLLDSDEQVEELPRRYLPVSCSNCAYRAFIEENTEWQCPKCRYYQFGEENGIHFDRENILNNEKNEL